MEVSDMGMMINRRRAYGGKSLPYDAEIEYLESTGTQYIDTGVFLVNTVQIKLDINAHNNGHIATCYSQGHYMGGIYAGGGYYCARWRVGASGNNTVTSNITINQRVLIEYNKNIFKVSDYIYNYNRNFYDTNSNIFIFAGNGGSYAANFVKAKMYYCTIQNNGVLVRDFIPVRVGQVGYMYDKVSGQLFGNSRIGDFILGPDVNNLKQ